MTTLHALLSNILRPVSQEEHWETYHLSEPDFHARRFHFDEIAKLHSSFTQWRDEAARLCAYWRVDAGWIEDVARAAADNANDLLGAVRKEYRRD